MSVDNCFDMDQAGYVLNNAVPDTVWLDPKDPWWDLFRVWAMHADNGETTAAYDSVDLEGAIAKAFEIMIKVQPVWETFRGEVVALQG